MKYRAVVTKGKGVSHILRWEGLRSIVMEHTVQQRVTTAHIYVYDSVCGWGEVSTEEGALKG
jgi:hypothetical protein